MCRIINKLFVRNFIATINEKSFHNKFVFVYQGVYKVEFIHLLDKFNVTFYIKTDSNDKFIASKSVPFIL